MLSPDSDQTICDDSGHFPQITQPDVVVSVVKEIAGKY